MEKIHVQVNTTIAATVQRVFEAIIEPVHLNNYFASKSSGPIAEGQKIIWYFEDAGVQCDVHILHVKPFERIEFEWNATGQTASRVLMVFEEKEKNTTLLKITESSFEFTAEDVKNALGQTQGWTDFACSLKAYLYTGINLRNGKNKGVNSIH